MFCNFLGDSAWFYTPGGSQNTIKDRVYTPMGGSPTINIMVYTLFEASTILKVKHFKLIFC